MPRVTEMSQLRTAPAPLPCSGLGGNPLTRTENRRIVLVMERPSRRMLDALTWAAAVLYALGFAIFIVIVQAQLLSLLWLVITLVLAALALSLVVELQWRRRKRERGRPLTR